MESSHGSIDWSVDGDEDGFVKIHSRSERDAALLCSTRLSDKSESNNAGWFSSDFRTSFFIHCYIANTLYTIAYYRLYTESIFTGCVCRAGPLSGY